MNTIRVQVIDEKAYQLLRDLEELNLIRILEEPSKPEENISQTLAGKLSKEAASQLQKNIEKGRDEWDRMASWLIQT